VIPLACENAIILAVESAIVLAVESAIAVIMLVKFSNCDHFSCDQF
jgi:hypothetical protein